MKSTLLFAVYFYALLSSGSGDDKRWFQSLVDLVELDYEDRCEQRANAAWEELVGNNRGLSDKLEHDKAYGIFAKQQANELRNALKSNTLGPEDQLLKRKVDLLLNPGDTLLETEQWIRLVTFGDTAVHKLRFSTNYDCGNNATCGLREFQNNLARQQDEEKLRNMKMSWEENLPNLTEYMEQILPLLRNASKLNNYKTIEEYWDALTEYEGAILKARELWDHIKPLYMKLHKYVALRLKGMDGVGKPLPVHLLRSLTGDDWSNLIEILLPKHADIYQKMHAKLQLRELGGLNAFNEASKLMKSLNLGEIEASTLENSLFNESCPPILIDWCTPNKVLVASCKDVSIRNYLEAHEAAMKIKYKQITALHSNNTYTLREAARFSAIYEAIAGFASLLALTPHALDRAGLYKLERFKFNPNHHRLVLQMIMALRDLPKLNLYLAADEWRLQVLMGTTTVSKPPTSWSEFRKEFSLLDVSDVDVLGDPYVLFNKPFIGKFMGLILKYQVYQSFAEELISDESDLIEHVGERSTRLSDTMMQGFGVMWPDLVSDLLAKRENGLEYTGLTDYYRLLDEYIDNQLDPSGADTNDILDYVEPPAYPPENEIIENEIPVNVVKEMISTTAVSEVHDDNILENVVDISDDHNSKLGDIETSTVAVMEIKNALNEKVDEPKVKSAYSNYWWIGIAVAVIIVLLIAGIIAKKRHSHRKQLEKQRRETSHA